MDIKNFIFKYIEKLILGITVCYLIYTFVHNFIILNLETHRMDTKLLSLSSTIDRKLKASTSPAIDTELKDAAQLEQRLATPPSVSFLQRHQVFSKFSKGEAVSEVTTRDLLKKQELEATRRLEGAPPGNIEFIFKGGTTDMALIQVRKLYKDKWWVESFVVEKEKTIGEMRIIGNDTVNFDTQCKLIEIIPLAQKPFVIKKTVALRDEKGEFLGTSITEETHMISTSKIVFETKKGESCNLWIGELVNIGTDTITVQPTNISSTN
ncbi:MAG: hypothetical protein A2Y09_02740 [Planctomycetes bacterium GWA2_39_15]|nr:MAG: hypothetical protein A2Y09_02740 [Planctomycetes bacterium GWA2_39_15]